MSVNKKIQEHTYGHAYFTVFESYFFQLHLKQHLKDNNCRGAARTLYVTKWKYNCTCTNLIVFTNTATGLETQWYISTSQHPVHRHPTKHFSIISQTVSIYQKMTKFCTAIKTESLLDLHRFSNQIFILLWKGRKCDNVESSDTAGNVGSSHCKDLSAILLLFNLYANINAVICVCHLRLHSIMCSLMASP